MEPCSVLTRNLPNGGYSIGFTGRAVILDMFYRVLPLLLFFDMIAINLMICLTVVAICLSTNFSSLVPKQTLGVLIAYIIVYILSHVLHHLKTIYSERQKDKQRVSLNQILL